MDANEVIEREKGLKRIMPPRQLTMIGIGGAIGTGLFSWAATSPLRMLARGCWWAMRSPHSSRSRSCTACRKCPLLTRRRDRSAPTPICTAQVVAVGGEAVAIGHYVQFWAPDMPVWFAALLAGGGIFYINSRSVVNFDTGVWNIAIIVGVPWVLLLTLIYAGVQRLRQKRVQAS